MDIETKLKSNLIDNMFSYEDETRLNTSKEILIVISAIAENKTQAERIWDNPTEKECLNPFLIQVYSVKGNV